MIFPLFYTGVNLGFRRQGKYIGQGCYGTECWGIIFGTNTEKLTAEWLKLRGEKLRDFTSHPT
jgi:hypothetical protein